MATLADSIFPDGASGLEPLKSLILDSNFPMRRPSWNQMPWISMPLTQTAIVPIPGTGVWTPMVTVTARSGYQSIIQSYVITAYGANSLANLQFRYILNGGLPQEISLLGAAEYNRSSPTSFPTFGRPNFQIVDGDQAQRRFVQLQALNPGPLQTFVLAAFYGYYAYDPNPNEHGTSQGLTDA